MPASDQQPDIAVNLHGPAAESNSVLDALRPRLPSVQHFVALEGRRDGWLDYEALVAREAPAFSPADVGEHDLLTINYTSGTTARPKGVMITHRNAYMNVMGTLVHQHLTPADR